MPSLDEAMRIDACIIFLRKTFFINMEKTAFGIVETRVSVETGSSTGLFLFIYLTNI